MIRSLCVCILLLLSVLARGSKDGDVRFVSVEFAKRIEPVTRGQIIRRVEARKLDRRHSNQPILPPHGKATVPSDHITAGNLEPFIGKSTNGASPTNLDPYRGKSTNGASPTNLDPYRGKSTNRRPTNLDRYIGKPAYSLDQTNGYPFGQYPPNGGYWPTGYGRPRYVNGVDGYDGGSGYFGASGNYGSGTISDVDVTSASSSGMYAAGGAYAGAGGYSIDGVLGGYNNLLALIQNYQSIFAAGQISAQIATQQIEQLAVQFQTAITQFQACTPCLGSGISSFGGVFSRLFSSFHSLVLSYQQFFPNNLTSMFGGAFSGLNTSLASFLSVCQSSGLTVNTFFPRPLASFFGRIGFGSVTSRLQQFGYSL